MDVVTHGMMGVIVASPFISSHPIPASCFLFGTVLPDLDALGRLFGKRAFLQAHQTYSHSIPIILALGLLGWALLPGEEFRTPWAPAALVLGMVLHSLLDVTNTYGITLLAPFSRRRFSTDWVFFIDATVIAVTIPTLLYVGWRWNRSGEAGWVVQALYVAILLAYWTGKVLLRNRARRLAPGGTRTLLPSALTPWQFLGYAREGSRATLFRVSAIDGALSLQESREIHDDEWHRRLAEIPEFRVMRGLSPAYHVVEARETAQGTRLACQDLRTRNFHTRFGELEVVLDSEGAVVEKTFHV